MRKNKTLHGKIFSTLATSPLVERGLAMVEMFYSPALMTDNGFSDIKSLNDARRRSEKDGTASSEKSCSKLCSRVHLPKTVATIHYSYSTGRDSGCAGTFHLPEINEISGC